jgi:tripartite-type tricarboxylate transporter receptor subunit TctC
MEMLKSAAGVNLTHIPYRGAGPAVADLLGNQVQAGFFVPGNVQQFAKDGKLKLIASSGPKRFPSTPDVPTLAESGFKDFEATSWIGFLTAANTPRPIVDRYNRELVKIIRSPRSRSACRTWSSRWWPARPSSSAPGSAARSRAGAR